MVYFPGGMEDRELMATYGNQLSIEGIQILQCFFDNACLRSRFLYHLVSSCITETPAYKNEPSQLIREDLVQYIKILHQRYQDCLPPEQVFCQLLSPVAVWKPRLALADGGMRHI